MSRKFNTKKFIKDVLYDRYAFVTPLLSSFGAVKEMAGSSHTPACCLSKPRSSLEAGKKQRRVWLQYVCGVEEMLFNPSYSGPLVLLWSPYGDSKKARNGFEEGSKWYVVSGDVCSSVNEAGFVGSRTYVHEAMNLCSCFETII